MNFAKLNLTNHKRQLSSFNESSHPKLPVFFPLWKQLTPLSNSETALERSQVLTQFHNIGFVIVAVPVCLFVFLKKQQNFLLPFFPVLFLAQVEFHDSTLPPVWRLELETAVVLPSFFPAPNVLGELSMVLDLELCLTDRNCIFVMFWEML